MCEDDGQLRNRADFASVATLPSLSKNNAERIQLLAQLPPLPEPDYRAMRRQSTGGCSSVFTIVITCVGGTHLGLWMVENHGYPDYMFVACKCFIYADALLAVCCLVGLLWADPGVLKRDSTNCFPIPDEVAQKLCEGESMDLFKNIIDGGKTYCTRCLLWRSDAELEGHKSLRWQKLRTSQLCRAEGFHHCSICQRCVKYFDHHCGFYGRCIAGRGLAGNMIYFQAIIFCGYFGCLMTGSTLLLGFGLSKYGFYVAMAAFVYILGSCLVLTLVSITFFIAKWCKDCALQAARRMPRSDLVSREEHGTEVCSVVIGARA